MIWLGVFHFEGCKTSANPSLESGDPDFEEAPVTRAGQVLRATEKRTTPRPIFMGLCLHSNFAADSCFWKEGDVAKQG
ncbi:Gamma-Aminobutyric Acid Receptor Subunit Rho-1 [Manis pentadactyla]|nr:Gamma-Aminobutyric Acid Receptor Subunit Rho-1 [Manis pentadactyla]